MSSDGYNFEISKMSDSFESSSKQSDLFNSQQGDSNLDQSSIREDLFPSQKLDTHVSTPVQILHKFYINKEDEFYRDNQAPKCRI